MMNPPLLPYVHLGDDARYEDPMVRKHLRRRQNRHARHTARGALRLVTRELRQDPAGLIVDDHSLMVTP